MCCCLTLSAQKGGGGTSVRKRELRLRADPFTQCDITIMVVLRLDCVRWRAQGENSAIVSRSGLVFPSPETGRQLVDIKRPFGEACKAAGISGLRFHNLRHTAATRLADAGSNVIVIA